MKKDKAYWRRAIMAFAIWLHRKGERITEGDIDEICELSGFSRESVRMLIRWALKCLKKAERNGGRNAT